MSNTNYQVNIVFAAIEAAKTIEEKQAFLSDDKAATAQKNKVNRLKVNDNFCKLDNDVLALIAEHSSEQVLENLLSCNNYKTAQRVADVAKMLSNKKHSTIIDYTISALEKSMLEKTTIDQLCARTNQCYSRIANSVRALQFFNIVIVDNIELNKCNLIKSLSKESSLKLNKTALLAR